MRTTADIFVGKSVTIEDAYDDDRYWIGDVQAADVAGVTIIGAEYFEFDRKSEPTKTIFISWPTVKTMKIRDFPPKVTLSKS